MVSDRVQFTFHQTVSLARWATNSTIPPGAFVTILLMRDTDVTLATIEHPRVGVLLRFASGQVFGHRIEIGQVGRRRRARRRRLVLVPLGLRHSARGCATGLGISSQRRGGQETPTARRDAGPERGRHSARTRISQRFLPIRSRRPGGKPEPVRSTMIDYMGMPDRAGTRIVIKRPIEPWRELPMLSAERTITLPD